MPEQLDNYLHTVEDQIRWKRARAALIPELRTHLLEQYEDCLAERPDPSAAEAETLRQMGDPVTVGQELDRVHRPRPQWGLLCLTAALALTGGFLRVWLTAGSGDPYLAISPQKTLFSVALGFAFLLAAYFLDYSLLGRYAKQIYFGAIALGILSLWFSPAISNASYYTRYVVLLFPVVYALLLFSLRGKGWSGLLLAILGGIPLVGIALLAPYLLGLQILLFSGCVLLLVSIWKDWFGVSRKIAAGAVLTGSLAAVCGFCWAFRWNLYVRLERILHPELDPFGSGYQATVLREALEGAQPWGRGQFSGIHQGQSYWYVVPGGDADCFLTTFIYHLGWVPVLLLCAALLGLLLLAFIKCVRQRNALGCLLSLSVLLTFGLQFTASLFLNLGFVFTSATCPFLVGNLHTILDMGLTGLMLSVFRQEHLPSLSHTVKRIRYTIVFSIQKLDEGAHC